MADNYAVSLEALPRHPEVVIPVERIAGRLLLVCGEVDDQWPSCPMSRQIQERLREHQRPEATLLAYKDAGHRAFGPPLPPDHPRLAKGDAMARTINVVLADSWQRTIAFLKSSLSN